MPSAHAPPTRAPSTLSIRWFPARGGADVHVTTYL